MAIRNNAEDHTAPDSNAWEGGPHRTGVAKKAEQERRTLSRRVLLLSRLSRSVLQRSRLSGSVLLWSRPSITLGGREGQRSVV